MLSSIFDNYKKLKENHAFGVILHPEILKNYNHYQRELKERPLIMKSAPPSAEIELTNRCNLACVQCLRSLGLKPYTLGDMSFDTYKIILAQFPYLMNLSLNGFGEPTMHKQFCEVVEYTRKERPWCKIGIYSNGMLIDENKAEQLIHCGLTELNISIDAATSDTYKRVRRGGKLEVVHENIKRLVEIKKQSKLDLPLIGINFVMLNENEGELVPFIEQAAEFGVDFINCITYASYNWGFQNRRTPENYKHELDAAAKRMEELDVRCKSFPSDDISWTSAENQFDCDFFWGQDLRITHEGEITLGCCSPFKETFSYGNILKQPFKKIWNNELFKKNREMGRAHTPPNNTCLSCDAYCKRFFANEDKISISSIKLSS